MAEGERGGHPVAAFADVPAFVRGVAFDALPDDVVASAQRSLLDLIGVGAAASRTRASAIGNGYAATQLGGSDRGARILFDGRRAGLAGAAFAGATTIDALDAHDGHVLTKGHAGVAILPALLALVDGAAPDPAAPPMDGREFLACLVLGYEIATRAGIALHSSVADYHCSGAWNALACAAVVGRLVGLNRSQLREALGVAEYIAPRGQILRVCAHPTMLKDGSSWGAHAGVTAAILAGEGFTGAPAITLEDAGVRPHWNDLGERWRIREQYFKAYPVCRWAQPAIEAALALKRAYRFEVDDIVGIGVESFREAIDLGARCASPGTTDEAQYSLAFGVAAALVFERVGADEVNAAGATDPRLQRMYDRMVATEDADFSRRFPAERWARIRLRLADGRTLVSEPARARGNPENPLSDEELAEKYRGLATPALGKARTERIERLVASLLTQRNALPALLDELLSPVA